MVIVTICGYIVSGVSVLMALVFFGQGNYVRMVDSLVLAFWSGLAAYNQAKLDKRS